MPNRKTIKGPDGRSIEVEEMPFRSGSENWNEYLLEDGSVIRLKTIVTEVQRVVNQWDAEGNPAYLFKTANVVNVNAPEKLRREDDDVSSSD